MKTTILLLLPLLSLCWWDVGHMLTAAIAQIRLNQLDSYAAANFRELVNSINGLCDNKSRSFIESACWPDDIKAKQYSMNLFDPWHFKDSPYIVDTVVPVINYTEAVVSSIEVMATASKVLKMNVKKNTAERALFARYAIHLAGDIHQPLHSVALFNQTYPKGDIGGNAHKVILTNTSISNFHAYWDAGAYLLQNDTWFIVRPMNLQNITALKEVANGMIKTYGPEVEQLGKIIDPLVWAQESFLIAQNTTYPFISKTNKLDAAYNTLAYETSKKRITLAGYRLANYVINIYQNASISSTPSQSILESRQSIWKIFMQHARKANLHSNINSLFKIRNILTTES